MIRLSRMTQPVEADLSAIYPGVKVTVRRLTSPEITEARDRALDALRLARDGLAALAPYGLDGQDANGVRLNPLDVEQMTRAGRLVGAVELCLAALVAWEGIALEDGSPAPIDRETLSILLLDDGIERAILAEVEKASRILVSEGNVSGGSPVGSSAIPPKMTADPNTAQAARPATPPAAEGKPSKTADTAPSKRTRPARSRAPRSGDASAPLVRGTAAE